jgi:hypothetical protein
MELVKKFEKNSNLSYSYSSGHIGGDIMQNHDKKNKIEENV